MEFVNLSNICDVYSGYAFKNFNDKKEGKPVIKIRNIKIDGTINKFDCSYTNEVPLEKFYSQKEDLYIALSGATTGKVGIMDEEGYLINQRVGVIRKKDINVPINYIKVFLDSITGKILKDAVGAAQPNISPKDILKYKFPLRRYDEMVKISNIFTNINNKINICKKYILNLDDIVKSQFIEMFENKGFELLPIKELVDIKKISAKKKFNSDEAIKYIDISSIDNERNVIKGYTNYLMKDAPSRAQQCLKKNDILISTVRPNLKNIAIFKDDDLYYVGSSGFCILRAKNVNSDYLKYVVLDDKFTNAMADLTTGASYPAIRDDDVLNYLMINAPIELQNKFADFVQQIDKSKFIVQKQIKLLEELLEKKMNEYFGQ